MKKILSFVLIFFLISSMVLAIEPFNQSRSPISVPSGALQCADGIDNDGDGLLDFDGHGDVTKKDLGCFGPADNDEKDEVKINPALNTTENKSTESKSESDPPWGMILGLAGPGLFLLAGLAKDDKGAADLAKDKLKGVGSNQLAAAFTPSAPQILQGVTLVQSASVDATSLAIQTAQSEVQKKIFETLASSDPKVKVMLELYEKVNGAYDEGKVLFFEGNEKEDLPSGNIKIDYEHGVTSFDNVGFVKGEDGSSADISDLVLNREQLEKKDGTSLSAHGFSGSKKEGITTLKATQDQSLELNAHGITRTYKDMKEGSEITLNEQGEIVKARIDVGGEGRMYVFGDKSYVLPKNAHLEYDQKTGDVLITQLGEERATLYLLDEKGKPILTDPKKKFNLEGEGRFEIKNDNTIFGFDKGAKLTYLGEEIEFSPVEDQELYPNKKKQGLFVAQIVEDKGVLVERGIATKDHFKFTASDEKSRVFLVQSKLDEKELTAYLKKNPETSYAFIKKDATGKVTGLDVRAGSDNIESNTKGPSSVLRVNFEIEKDEHLFKFKSPKSLVVGEGAKLSVTPPLRELAKGESYVPHLEIGVKKVTAPSDSPAGNVYFRELVQHRNEEPHYHPTMSFGSKIDPKSAVKHGAVLSKSSSFIGTCPCRNEVVNYDPLFIKVKNLDTTTSETLVVTRDGTIHLEEIKDPVTFVSKYDQVKKEELLEDVGTIVGKRVSGASEITQVSKKLTSSSASKFVTPPTLEGRGQVASENTLIDIDLPLSDTDPNPKLSYKARDPATGKPFEEPEEIVSEKAEPPVVEPKKKQPVKKTKEKKPLEKPSSEPIVETTQTPAQLPVSVVSDTRGKINPTVQTSLGLRSTVPAEVRAFIAPDINTPLKVFVQLDDQGRFSQVLGYKSETNSFVSPDKLGIDADFLKEAIAAHVYDNQGVENSVLQIDIHPES